MSSESEMTKETSSGCTPLSIFYRCPRLMQGLSLVSGLGLLSSGLVMAQTESSSDTGAAPTPTTAPAVEAPPAPPSQAPAPTARAKPTVPETIVVPATPTVRKPARLPEPFAATKPAIRQRPPVPFAAKKPAIRARAAESSAPRSTTVVRRKRPLAAPNLSIRDNSSITRPPKVILNPAPTQERAKIPVAPTNNYIDRTDYSIGATRRYEGPNQVVLTERSTGCRTVSQNGQLSSGACGVAAPSQQTANLGRVVASQPMANLGRPVPSQQTVNSERSVLSQQTAKSGRLVASQQTANLGRLVASQQTANLGRLVASQQTANLGRLVASQQTAKSGSTVLSQQTAKSGSTVLSQQIANSRRTLEEPQLNGVIRLPMPPVAAVQPVKLGLVKSNNSGVRTTRQTKSYAGRPTTPTNWSYSSSASAESSTTPTGLSYYNLTSRPAGRPNIGKTSFMFPLTIPSAITSLFGWRIHPITGDRRFHAGTDLGAPLGTPVVAAAFGQVLTADFLGGYGLTVVLQHEQGTDESLYAHLSEIFVQPGDQVEQGTVIGRVGSTGNSTGPHLHFEWRHLTADGWVAVDAGAHLEYSLVQFIRALQVAQAAPQRGL